MTLDPTLPLGRLFDLSGRVELVTGGSRGLGKAMARALAEAGADIVIASRHEPEASLDAAGEIGQGLTVACGISSWTWGAATRWRACPRRPWRRWGLSPWSWTMTGVFMSTPLVVLSDDEDRDAHAPVDSSTASLELARALAPAMIERRWGRILHESSVAARVAEPGGGLA